MPRRFTGFWQQRAKDGEETFVAPPPVFLARPLLQPIDYVVYIGDRRGTVIGELAGHLESVTWSTDGYGMASMILPLRDAFAARRRQQPVVRRHGIQILGDDPRIIKRALIVQQQHGNLAQRIGSRHLIALDPGRIEDEVAIDLLFRKHDADLADVRTGKRSDQFHLFTSEKCKAVEL